MPAEREAHHQPSQRQPIDWRILHHMQGPSVGIIGLPRWSGWLYINLDSLSHIVKAQGIILVQFHFHKVEEALGAGLHKQASRQCSK